MRVAAIDVGTNTTRLLVAEGEGASYRDLDRRLIFTRLGQGIDVSKAISPGSLDRTVRAITEFCAVAGELAVEDIRVCGTSAVRDAANKQEFLTAVSKITGKALDVLSGDDEARLSFIGATTELDFGLYLVSDIGGGSTEFVLGQPMRDVQGRVSIDIGSVRLTERHLLSDPPATEEMLTLEADIDDALALVDVVIPTAGLARFVGVAGTVTSLAALFLGAEEYDPTATHHMKLSRSAVNALYHELANTSSHDRAKLPALPEGRADVIVAGASILSRTMAKWGFSEVIVSEKDILDGIVLEMLGAG